MRKAAVRAMGYFVNSENNQLEHYTQAALVEMCDDFENSKTDIEQKSPEDKDGFRTTVLHRILFAQNFR